MNRRYHKSHTSQEIHISTTTKTREKDRIQLPLPKRETEDVQEKREEYLPGDRKAYLLPLNKIQTNKQSMNNVHGIILR